MEYLPPRPLDAHNAFLLASKSPTCISGAISRSLVWILITIFPPPQPNAWQRRWSTFFAEQRIGWQLELAAERAALWRYRSSCRYCSATAEQSSAAAVAAAR
jgi:fructosamine-3-kinase